MHFFRGIFLWIFYVFSSTLLHLPPLRFHALWVGCCDLAYRPWHWQVRRCNHLARSHLWHLYCTYITYIHLIYLPKHLPPPAETHTTPICILWKYLIFCIFSALFFIERDRKWALRGQPVEGLYCKRPIQRLASSELLNPHPLTARRVYCVPPSAPAFGAGEGHSRWVERGWGVNSSEDSRHCSVLYLFKYFMGQQQQCQHPYTKYSNNWPRKGGEGVGRGGRDQWYAWVFQRFELWSRIQRKTWCMGPICRSWL
jgi:hypothetical protein